MRILKYEIPKSEGVHALWLPRGAKILSIQNQYNKIAMWVTGDVGGAPERRWFAVVHTGGLYLNKSNFKYLATVLLDQGAYVTHIFEEGC